MRGTCREKEQSTSHTFSSDERNMQRDESNTQKGGAEHIFTRSSQGPFQPEEKTLCSDASNIQRGGARQSVNTVPTVVHYTQLN